MNKFSYLFKKGLRLYKNNFKNLLSSAITLLTVFFIYQLIFTIGYSVNEFFSSLTSVQSIRVYLKSDEKESVDDLIEKIKGLNTVQSVTYYDSKSAYDYLKTNSYNVNYLEKIPSDFYPSFIEVTILEKFRDLKYISSLEDEIKKFEMVDVASYGEKWVMNFVAVRYSIQVFIFLITLLFSASTAFVIINTISLTMFKFKSEIQVYNLVGATKSFIIMPFLFSSIFEFILSYSVSAAASIGFLMIVKKNISSIMGVDLIVIPNFFIYFMITMYFFLLTICAGYFSSSRFVKKAGSIND